MQNYLESFSGHRVAVVGDLMLDCYLAGDVTRISPEAPVPVMRVKSENLVPGGAANVAANLASLGLGVELVGLVGLDEAGRQLVDAVACYGDIHCAGVIAAKRSTTRKLRVIGAQQQIVRIDHEDTTPCDGDLQRQIIRAARDAVDRADALVLSDYGKGVFADAVLEAIIGYAAKAGKHVVVDPKRRDLSVYRGATILTPNRRELTEATQLPCETDTEAESAARRAQEICGADILLTRSEKGMTFFPVNGDPFHVATVAQDVFDVSGAGDTVVAVLAASIAAGAPLADGIRLANHAAGIVVSKLGTATVSRDELAAALREDPTSFTDANGGLISLEQAVAMRWNWSREKLTVGFTNGCFDLLHPGHISLIRHSSDVCDRLIVALNTDASVRRLKGPSRPIQDEQARASVMGAIKGVAAVILFDEDTPLSAITALQPDVLIKGADYTLDNVIGADVVAARGGRVVLAKLDAGRSTSKLVAKTRASSEDYR